MCLQDHAGLTLVNDRLERRLRNTKEIVITTDYETDLALELAPLDIGWVKEDKRMLFYGEWINLPCGEIYTVPADANGVLVLYGVIQGYEKHRFFDKNPVTFKIEDGELIEMTCKTSTYVIGELEAELFDTENSRAIAELGFGTNYGIKKMMFNVLSDEKFPGVHIAFGDPALNMGKAWEAPHHVYMVLLHPTVYADGRRIMQKGVYLP